MRNFTSSLILVASLFFAFSVSAQQANTVAPKSGVAPKAKPQATPSRTVQKMDPASIAKKYLADNCIISLKVYSVDPSDYSVDGGGGATGYIVAIQGTSYILTNAHVVRKGTDIWALFDHDIAPQELRLTGKDDAIDTALLTFADKKFKAPCVIPLGDSDTLSIGDEVFTISNPSFAPFAFSKGYIMKTNSLVFTFKDEVGGITSLRLSAIHSEFNINPGSSGSPLFNTRGEAIGINQGVIHEENIFNPVSVSIPINLVKRGLPEILKGGGVAHGFINVAVVDSTRYSPLDKYTLGISTRFRNGPIVLLVPIFSSAERAGIQKDDMIVAINGTPTPTVNDLFTHMLFTLKPGTVAKVTVLREEDHAGAKEWAYKDIEVAVEEFRVTFR